MPSKRVTIATAASPSSGGKSEPVRRQENSAAELTKTNNTNVGDVPSSCNEEHPDSEFESFTIGISSYARAISRVLKDVRLPTPLLMGLIGPLGSGKSRLMSLIVYQLTGACSAKCPRLGTPPEPRNVNWQILLCNCLVVPFFKALLTLVILVLLFSVGVSIFMILSFLRIGLLSTIDLVNSEVYNVTGNVTSSSTTGLTPSPPIGSIIPTLTDNVAVPLIVAGVFVGVLLLLFLLAGGIVVCGYYDSFNRSLLDLFHHFKIILIMFLCNPPDPPSSDIVRTEIFPILFNARHYAGSDKLWPAIISHLFTEMECLFGLWKTRLYRVTHKNLQHQHTTLLFGQQDYDADIDTDFESFVSKLAQPDLMTTEPTVKNSKEAESQPRTCCSSKCCGKEEQNPPVPNVILSNSYWFCFPYAVVIMLVTSIVMIAIVALVIFLVAYDLNDVQSLYILAFNGVMGSVAGVTVLANLKKIYALFESLLFSQSARVSKFMGKGNDGLKGDLGYMKKVMDEIQILMGFIRTMEHLYQKKFRICMMIDDLDKCPDKQVVQILEALSILLNDDENDHIIAIVNVEPADLMRQVTKGGKDGINYLSRTIDLKLCIPQPDGKELYHFMRLLEDQCELTRALQVSSSHQAVLMDLKQRRKRNSKRRLSVDSDNNESNVVDMEEGLHPPLPKLVNYYQSIKDAPELEGFQDRTSTEPTSRLKSRPVYNSEAIEMDERMPLIRRTEFENEAETRLDDSKFEPSTSGLQDEDASAIKLSKKIAVGKTSHSHPNLKVFLRGVNKSTPPKSLELKSLEKVPLLLSRILTIGKPEWLISQLAFGTKDIQHTRMSPKDGVHSMAFHLSAVTSNFANTNPKIKTELSRFFRRYLFRVAVETLHKNIDLVEGSYKMISQLLKSMFFCFFIWEDQLRQSNVLEALQDPSEANSVPDEIYYTCIELAQWLLICEQWPYKTSWVVQACSGNKSKHADSMYESIETVWYRIKSSGYTPDLSPWSVLDYNLHNFELALHRFSGITSLTVRRFLPFSINISRSLVSEISLYIDESCEIIPQEQNV